MNHFIFKCNDNVSFNTGFTYALLLQIVSCFTFAVFKEPHLECLCCFRSSAQFNLTKEVIALMILFRFKTEIYLKRCDRKLPSLFTALLFHSICFLGISGLIPSMLPVEVLQPRCRDSKLFFKEAMAHSI